MTHLLIDTFFKLCVPFSELRALRLYRVERVLEREMSLTLASTIGAENGLWMSSTAPTSNPFCSSAASVLPVRNIIGISQVAGSALTAMLVGASSTMRTSFCPDSGKVLLQVQRQPCSYVCNAFARSHEIVLAD